ncbi:MAG TPA: acyltransferase [Pirellulales bacterium]|jgi:peptidoglycan/LPS O-acetylase OafA/YrhL|nr:acyltransferase [Pirellulales bacterium]
MKRLPHLDGLRGCAIALVLVFHFLFQEGAYALHPVIARALSLTWSGVDLFFVLSGFLLGGILFDNQRAENYYRVFYLRRAVRILPLYVLVLVSFYAMRAFYPAGELWDHLFGNSKPWFSYATFTQNLHSIRGPFFTGTMWLAPTWSLAIEEQFYLFLPLFLRTVPRRRLPATLGILIASAPLTRIALYNMFPHGQAWVMLLPCRWDSLLLGVLAAWSMRYYPIASGWLYAAFVAGLGGMAAIVFQTGNSFAWQHAYYGYTIIGATCAAALLLAIRGGAAWAWLTAWPLLWLGQVSYAVYMFHEPVSGLVQGWVRAALPRLSPATAFALAITLVLAWLSWRWFEGPLVRAGHRWKYCVPPEQTEQAIETGGKGAMVGNWPAALEQLPR